MKKKIAIYLAGSIKKGHEKSDEAYWSEEDRTLIKNSLSKYEVSFLNPALRTDDLTDNHSVFGRDMLQVFCSHFVFVDARDRRGLGVGAEMMWAKMHGIPVVTWAPYNSHYRKDRTTILDTLVENFIHPFVESLSDKIVDNLMEGSTWIDFVMTTDKVEIKDAKFVHFAMQYYKDSQLHKDQPMKELFSENDELRQRAYRYPTFVPSY